jgi:hypothetical protein
MELFDPEIDVRIVFTDFLLEIINLEKNLVRVHGTVLIELVRVDFYLGRGLVFQGITFTAFYVGPMGFLGRSVRLGPFIG